MLPERISSDLCSLRAGEDRLVIAACLAVGREGEIQDASFHAAVIRSRRSLSYPQAAPYVSDPEGLEKAPE